MSDKSRGYWGGVGVVVIGSCIAAVVSQHGKYEAASTVRWTDVLAALGMMLMYAIAVIGVYNYMRADKRRMDVNEAITALISKRDRWGKDFSAEVTTKHDHKKYEVTVKEK